MSGLVFAGSAQLVVRDLWHTPIPAATIILTTLVVNLRHLLMGVAVQPWFARLSAPRRYVSAFFMTDENWALSVPELQHGRADGAILLGSGLATYATRAGGFWLMGRVREDKAKERSLYAGGTVAGTTKICWCCLSPGIYIQEFWLMVLEENIRSQMERRSAMELLDGTFARRVKTRLDDMKKVVLVRFTDLTAEQMTPLWQSKMPKMFKESLPVTRGAILCPPCAASCGLKYEPPNPTTEQLQASAVWLEISGLKQAIEDKIARNN